MWICLSLGDSPGFLTQTSIGGSGSLFVCRNSAIKGAAAERLGLYLSSTGGTHLCAPDWTRPEPPPMLYQRRCGPNPNLAFVRALKKWHSARSGDSDSDSGSLKNDLPGLMWPYEKIYVTDRSPRDSVFKQSGAHMSTALFWEPLSPRWSSYTQRARCPASALTILDATRLLIAAPAFVELRPKRR